MIVSLVGRRIDLVVKARRNRQFGCDSPRVTDEQHKAIGVSIQLGRGVERGLSRIHLLQQEAGDGAASRQVARRVDDAGFSASEIKSSRLSSEKDGGVLC